MKTNKICRRAWKQVLLFIAVIALFTGFSQPVSALTIKIIQSEGGTITASPESAKAGDTVTITVITDPEKGLKDNTLKANENVLNEKYNPSGKYTFTMPSVNVTVKAEFGDIFLLKTGVELREKFTSGIDKFVYGAKSEYTSQIPSWINCGSACEDDSDKAIVYRIDNGYNTAQAYILSDDVGLTRANPDCNKLFSYCSYLENVDLTSFDTSQVTNMSFMFWDCQILPRLDVSHFNTSQVTNMSSMFERCQFLPKIDVSNFDTSKVTNMSYMFDDCKKLTKLDLSNFDTSQVVDMGAMFRNCQKLRNLDISNFDTSKATSIINMFEACYVLKNIDVSSFDTSQVVSIDGLFKDCRLLTSLDLSKFDTSKVRTMARVFDGCYALKSLDISSFDSRKVNYMDEMFQNCKALTTIYASEKFVVPPYNDSPVFLNSPKLKAQRYKGSGEVIYDSSKVNRDMAKIATASVDGYFTDIRLKP